MPLIPSITDNIMTIRSVGDHTMQEGLAHLATAMEVAARHFCEHGEKLHLLFDMTESLEKKSSEELRDAAQYFGSHLEYLSGRVAVHAPSQLHFALSRVYSAYAEPVGIEVQPFYDRQEALDWLNP